MERKICFKQKKQSETNEEKILIFSEFGKKNFSETETKFFCVFKLHKKLSTWKKDISSFSWHQCSKHDFKSNTLVFFSFSLLEYFCQTLNGKLFKYLKSVKQWHRLNFFKRIALRCTLTASSSLRHGTLKLKPNAYMVYYVV